jgi:hypothetical protein
MSVSAISSSTAALAQLVQPRAESAEATAAGRDVKNDGDSDEGGGNTVQAPKPTVNFQGQQIGSIINVSA